MARQKELALQQAALSQGDNPQNNTVLGGIGTMLQQYFTGLGRYKAEQQEAEGNRVVSETLANIDPATGGTSEQLAAIGGWNPELMTQLWGDRSKRLADAAAEQTRLAERKEDREWQIADRDLKLGVDAADAAAKAADKGIEQEQSLRKEYGGTAEAKNYPIIKNALDRITLGVKSDDAAGDMAIVYGFMKLQDPESAVREGEYATAENSAGISDRITSIYNRVVDGDRLTPGQRAMFLKQAQGQYSNWVNLLGTQNKRFTDIATASGVDPARVVITPDTNVDQLNVSENDIINEGLAKARTIIQKNPAAREQIKQDLLDAGYPPDQVGGL
jgi:hypothetical protein